MQANPEAILQPSRFVCEKRVFAFDDGEVVLDYLEACYFSSLRHHDDHVADDDDDRDDGDDDDDDHD
eukprot:3796390-Karenia_brevis.AAC.1